MAENKTRPTDINVMDFIGSVADPVKRADSEKLVAMMARITRQSPVMWGDSMVGFGTYHYKYQSGREGDYFLTGFSPRKGALSIYLLGIFPEQAELLAKLGRHRMAKGCLYVKKLEDIDMDVLEELVRLSVGALKAAYPT